MSMMLMVKAMQIKVGNPLRKLVLLKLADNASDTGECWPSHQNIADQCEISKRSVINHIDALVEMGLLRVENRIKNNEKQSNIYYLTLDGHPLAEEPKKGSAGDALPSATDAPPSAGAAQGVVQELHIEPVTLLNLLVVVVVITYQKMLISKSSTNGTLLALFKSKLLFQAVNAKSY
nr:helix-turn-helix domain-containing protein [Wohlfahrtiimonas chitiniclastica]